MILIKAKQLDISTVAAGLTTFFTSDETSRDNFVIAIKDAPGFDEKVKAGSNVNDQPGYLIDKIIGDITGTAVQINITYDTTNYRLVVTPSVNVEAFIPLLLPAFTVLQFTATETMPTYENTDLIDKKIFYISREGFLLFEGSGSDEYSFDDETGIITFHAPVNINERMRIFYA